ncbi:N-acetylgalactosamine-6-sulfatase [Flammeovirga pectinis]|uniref:N-acetylgalactosamine-6-sulfatase n=2 Tax=Flammeovirga pectinis TaxID=2494373 RepID=A0A3S9PC13_9BACT|nr:N-acetylgalactosamine-6-sulfatase [Flammeovirga pectinis]
MFARPIYLLILLLLIFTNSNANPPAKKIKTTPPNIIIFLVDDMGLMDTSLPFAVDGNGNAIVHPLNQFYRTPNMEMLATQGTKFTNFYAHSVCSPTRTSLMTGQNSARHKVTNWIKSEENNKTPFGPKEWNWKGLDKENVTLPRVLQANGYKTIHVGKAHFGPYGSEGEDPINLGFDVNIAGSSIGQPGSYYGMEGFGHIAGNKARAVPGLEKYHNKDIFLTEALTLEANAAISKAKEEKKPFFLYMSHYALHAPFNPDPRFIDNYKDAGMNERTQAYASLVEGMDKSLGDLIEHVKKLGLGENTIILFMGDNGSDAPIKLIDNYGSSTPFKGKKGKHWDGGMRVPFITSWVTPNQKNKGQRKIPIGSNATQNQIGTVIDVFSTVCEISSTEMPEQYITDGFSLTTQFNGKENKKRTNEFINHFPHKHRSSYFTSFIDNDWKIIYHYQIKKAPKYELYNITNDPFETTNLAADNPLKLNEMMVKLEIELTQMEALYPEKGEEMLRLIIPQQ